MPFWKRCRPTQPSPAPVADPVRIAVLEHDLLGIEPKPGTPAAYAVALAKPVDPTTCPHEDVIDVTEVGQARATGMCQCCGGSLVEGDEGDWERP